MKKQVVIVDDHAMFADALAEIIEKDTSVKVAYSVRNGSRLIERLTANSEMPDLILLDLNMPVMDGHETALWLKENHPEIKVVVLTMNDQDEDIIRMLKAGCVGYLLKESPRAELARAIETVLEKGYYHSDLVTNQLVRMLREDGTDGARGAIKLSEREKEFLPYAVSELTYKEIADKMCVAERTVDGYRESLFQKFGVRSRVGLAIFAIKHGLVEV
jgi:two-component system invasion response regulator UvrY